jgi:hypothetical protein
VPPATAGPGDPTPTPTDPGQVAVVLPGDRGGGGPDDLGGNIDGRQPVTDAPNGGAALGLGFDWGFVIPIAVWSLTTALGVILFAAFLRRPTRRERVLVGAGLVVTEMELMATVPAAQVNGPGAPGANNEPNHPADVNPPPWLRRAGAREPARFKATPRPGVERRTIGYRLVRMSDGPDDIRSQEVGRVDRGDEVEVIAEHEGFLQVRTPSGLEGWVPRVVIVG